MRIGGVGQPSLVVHDVAHRHGEGAGQRFIIIDDAGERLLAGSHRRSGRSRIRAEGRAVVGGHQTEVRKLGERQIRRNRELAVRVFDATQIVLGRSHLRVAHAIADEHEHVLRLAFLNKMYSTGGM